MDKFHNNKYRFSSIKPLILISDEIIESRNQQITTLASELLKYKVLIRDLVKDNVSYSTRNELLNIAMFLTSNIELYDDFINKEDILKQHLVKLIQEWGTEFEQSKNPNFVESLFGHYLKYAETYQLLYKCGLSYLVLDTIKSVCGPKPEQENIQAYTNAWLACGQFGWIDEWIIRGMQESPIEMARLVEWSQQSNNSSPIN